MQEGFSESTIRWLNMQPLLASFYGGFRKEWSDMLREVERQQVEKGWKGRLLGDPPEMLQLYRDGWPPEAGGAHYEIYCVSESLRAGEIHLGLHLEGQVPHQQEVCAQLHKLLKSHTDRIGPVCGLKLAQEPGERILVGSLALNDGTVEKLCEALDRAAQAESFVDESLFLVRRNPVWRTDLLPNDPEVCTRWEWGKSTTPEGGWSYGAKGGRIGSRCLKLQSGKDNHGKGWNILWLQPEELFHDFKNGQQLYCAVTVYSTSDFSAEFCLETSEAADNKWHKAYEELREVSALDRWRLVTWEGKIETKKGHNFAQEGLYAYLLFNLPEGQLRIDSIEFGTC